MLGRVYTFLDWDGWSGERVVLRPDGTIPVARLYLENFEGADITRLFYVENTFTFEGTGKERRERWQCGAELIGSGQPVADVELILLATEVLERLGAGPVAVKLSHAGLIKALLSELGLMEAEQAEIWDQVLEGDAKALERVKTRNAALERVIPLMLEVKGNSSGFLKNIGVLLGESRTRLMPELDNLTEIAELLGAMKCSYQIDIASGRGFEYYTGGMFQFYANGERIGGGGRYNDLIPLVGGGPIPASGFALYVDKLMDRIKLEATGRSGVLISAKGGGAGQTKISFELAHSLRDAGCCAEINLGRKSAEGFDWHLVVLAENSFQLTNLATGRMCQAVSQAEVLWLIRGA
jgi:histidyl-tRNA synthetase